MSLIKWDPFRDLTNLHRSINRLFEDSFLRLPQRTGELTSAWMFPVDIQETAENVIVKAEIPGLSKEDIKVHFANNQLTIEGERKQETREEDTRYIRVERSYGSFCRSFAVDIPVKSDQIKASYKNGVLEVTLPKVEEIKPKEIYVEIKE